MSAPPLIDGDIVFRDFAIATMETPGVPFGLIPRGDLIVREGRILWVGPHDATRDVPPGCQVIHGQGRVLTPGWIDCHTHLLFAGTRAAEFERRLLGASYAEIARSGGGILSTVRATREASEEDLFQLALRRAQCLMRDGVTTLEVKTGYALSLEGELKLLRVARRLADALPIEIAVTLLAAHAVPSEYQGRTEDYVSLVCEQMIPAARGLAEAVDVFCESIAFSVDQSRRILMQARAHDFRLRIHAEQLSLTGGAAMAAELGADSADHLEYLDHHGVAALARHGTTAVLLPGAFYFLRETQHPPLAQLRSAGVPLALASDLNPGSSPIHSLQLIVNMGCVLFGMTPEEAVAGVTRNAARALGRGDNLGTICPGKWADLADWNVKSPEELAYTVAKPLCRATYRRGVLIHAFEI